VLLRLPARIRHFFQPMVRVSPVLQALHDLPVEDSRAVLGAELLLVLAPHPEMRA
jgi:hypothetical protein